MLSLSVLLWTLEKGMVIFYFADMKKKTTSWCYMQELFEEKEVVVDFNRSLAGRSLTV